MASDQVVLTAKQIFERYSPTTDDAPSVLKQIGEESHTVIRLTAVAAEMEPHSTFAAFILNPEGDCHWAHSGDSRIYHFHAGTLVKRTRDNSYVQALVDKGELTETPADENFLVFPPQGLVPTNGRQVVRVQWVGDPTIETSKAYYLSVRQLPVATTPTGEGGGSLQVSVLYTMKALIVVAPPGAEADVQVESVKPTLVAPPAAAIDPSLGGDAQPAPPQEPGLEVTVINRGKRYALMSGATWIVTGTDTSGHPYSQTLASQTVAATVGVGYLAPGGARRTFQIPTGGIALDPAKPVTVRFSR